MKKIILSFIGLLLVILTLHYSIASYGGVSGTLVRIQSRIVENIVVVTRDPGLCGLIR
jgi:hypothetical protein